MEWGDVAAEVVVGPLRNEEPTPRMNLFSMRSSDVRLKRTFPGGGGKGEGGREKRGLLLVMGLPARLEVSPPPPEPVFCMSLVSAPAKTTTPWAASVLRTVQPCGAGFHQVGWTVSKCACGVHVHPHLHAG